MALMSTLRPIDCVRCLQNVKRILIFHFESMADTVPRVFAPIIQRNKILYRNLLRQQLTIEEKTSSRNNVIADMGGRKVQYPWKNLQEINASHPDSARMDE